MSSRGKESFATYVYAPSTEHRGHYAGWKLCRVVYQPSLEHGDLVLACMPLGTQDLSFHSPGQSAKRQRVPVTEHTWAPSVRRQQEQNLQSLSLRTLTQFLKQDCCWWGGTFPDPRTATFSLTKLSMCSTQKHWPTLWPLHLPAWGCSSDNKIPYC